MWLIFALLSSACTLWLSVGARERWLNVRGTKSADADTEVQDRGIQDVPLILELLATCLDAGLPMPRALELLAEVAETQTREGLRTVVAGLSIGASWQTSWHPVKNQRVLGRLYDALTFAAVTGAPAASLLYAEAAQLRRSAQRDSERRAAALGVRLVIPLGLCSLPAFVCLGVAPVVIAMMHSFY